MLMNQSKFLAICMGLTMAANTAYGVELTSIQKKELMLFGMKAMGLKVGIEDIKKEQSMADIEKLVATGLNLNRHLCAQIV